MEHGDTHSILIVDDNPQNLQLLGALLKEKGYRVAVAQRGSVALEYVQKRRPDLILLDIMMPEMDGFTVCTKLKKNKSTGDIPVIFLTAKTDTESIVNAFETGARDYITKPFNQSEVLARIKNQLEIQRLTRSSKWMLFRYSDT